MSVSPEFDLKLADECAGAFSRATGIGCAVTGARGETLGSFGYSCAACRMCALAGLSVEKCAQAHVYGMREAERFGGKYIYFCALGLTCLVSPIIGGEEAVAKITAGPFLMVDEEDYIAYDLQELHALSGAQLDAIRAELKNVPYVEPSNATALSTLLFMSVGFMNNVSAAEGMFRTQRSDYLQGQISAYISELKRDGSAPTYPFRLEQQLIQHILQSDREKAQECLNQILGALFFSSGGNLKWICARCYELLAMISRTAVRGGGNPDYLLRLNDEAFEALSRCSDFDHLSVQLADALRRYMDGSFSAGDARHSDAVHNAIHFIQINYARRITLEDAAKHVYLSPTYLSRIFKQETGMSFTRFLNTVRIEKSKKLLQMTDMRLADIAVACGFEDQSYFTKVFKSIAKVTPGKFR